MNAIADALVYAVVAINLRDAGDEELDEDVSALESIAFILRNCTPAEEDALAAAAERAAAKERASKRPSNDWLHDFETWMEEMFVDGWEGNQRIAIEE